MPSSQPIGTKPSPLALLTKLASKRTKTAADASNDPAFVQSQAAQRALAQQQGDLVNKAQIDSRVAAGPSASHHFPVQLDPQAPDVDPAIQQQAQHRALIQAALTKAPAKTGIGAAAAGLAQRGAVGGAQLEQQARDAASGNAAGVAASGASAANDIAGKVKGLDSELGAARSAGAEKYPTTNTTMPRLLNAAVNHPYIAGGLAGAGVGALGIGAGMLLHHLLKRKTKTASVKTAAIPADELHPHRNFLAKLLGGGVVGAFGLQEGADEASAGKSLHERDRLRETSSFGSGLKSLLPSVGTALLGGGVGAALGGPLGAGVGARAGGLLGTIPNYFYAKHIGHANAQDALAHEALARESKGKTASLAVLTKLATKRAKTAGVWSDAVDGVRSFGRAGGGALDAAGSAITKTPVLKQLATGGAASAGLANAAGRLITRSTVGAPASSTATRLADPTGAVKGAVKGATSLSTPPSTTAPAVAPSESAAMGVVNRGADAVKGGLDAAGSMLGVPAAAMGVVNRGADDVKKGIDTVGGTIAAHPLASAGVAAGAGAILGLLLSRKSKKDEPAPPAARYAPI